jgi:hypothetical protein
MPMVCHKQPASARDKKKIVFVSFRIFHLLLSLAAAGRVPPAASHRRHRAQGAT